MHIQFIEKDCKKVFAVIPYEEFIKMQEALKIKDQSEIEKRRKKTIETLRQMLEDTPDYIINEVLDFVHFLKKKQSLTDTAVLSESSLSKDWLRSEEDEAWAHL